MSSLYRTIIVAFLTLLLGAGLPYELHVISSLENDVVQASDAIYKKVGSDSRSRSITATQISSKDELLVISDAILTKTDLVTLLEDIQKIGREKGLTVTISSIVSDINKGASSTTPDTVHVSIDAYGPWAASLNFLRLLENLPHKINVERAYLSFSQDHWSISATLRLTTNPQK